MPEDNVMSSWRRIILGFILAPILPSALVIGYGFAQSGFSYWKTLLFGFAFYLVGCYAVTIVAVIPAYMLLRKFLRINLTVCVTTGFIIGALLALIPFLLQLLGTWPMFDFYSDSNGPIILNHHFTAYGIRSNLQSVTESGAFGAVIAFVFWLIAVCGNRPVQQSVAEA